ncbi:DUF1922 domain-containing protein [Methanogenium organophilum]|uniref:DUF1922 domain-containing protein n=1 Tax=Methanogenium organophilum TaxID=2199 RepID=A0A9X9S571_METOG|nr:DUF1922 domain-containing protein [Methanogenium organophilum]WAI01130.1 DUF1922 domain-containing protein [Methanogenium organophilum]
MYIIVRCESCGTFTYIDRFQNWKLCPVCGETMQKSSVRKYLEVENHHDADAVVVELERYLHQNKRTDLTPDETRKLRAEYARRVSSDIH